MFIYMIELSDYDVYQNIAIYLNRDTALWEYAEFIYTRGNGGQRTDYELNVYPIDDIPFTVEELEEEEKNIINAVQFNVLNTNRIPWSFERST